MVGAIALTIDSNERESYVEMQHNYIQTKALKTRMFY